MNETDKKELDEALDRICSAKGAIEDLAETADLSELERLVEMLDAAMAIGESLIA